MKTLKFKSNIKCTGCLSKVSPSLNEEEGIHNWEVDLQADDRTLTVETSQLSTDEIKKAVERGGYTAELINEN